MIDMTDMTAGCQSPSMCFAPWCGFSGVCGLVTGPQADAIPQAERCWKCDGRRIHEGCNAGLCDTCCTQLKSVEPLLADIDTPLTGEAARPAGKCPVCEVWTENQRSPLCDACHDATAEVA